MFEKMIVSTADRRSGRTVRFFLGTSMFYLLVVGSVLAISVIVDSPKLPDVSTGFIRVGPLPQLGGKQKPPPRGPQPPTRTAYTGNLVPADDSNRTTPHGSFQPPNPDRITIGTGPGGPGNEGGIVGGIGSGDSGTGGTGTAAPPQPVRQRTPAPTPQASHERPMVRVPSSVLQGKAIERRTPPYPPIARQIHLHGDVIVEIIISPEGKVESARLVSGHPLLAQAAVDAAWGWRFQPTMLNGVPVRATGMITFVFKLD